MQRRSVRRCDARDRAQVHKKLRERRGSDRSICPVAIDLCCDGLAAIGVRLSCRGKRELVFVLQRVLCTTKEGASLPLREFSSKELGRKILTGLVETGLIFCVDPDSWKPRDWDFTNATARRFLPSSELILANAGPWVVDNAFDYLDRRYQFRGARQESEVILYPESGVEISPNVVDRLVAGTGLTFNLRRAIQCLEGKAEFEQAKLLLSAQPAVGFLGIRDPIHTRWEQKPCGRLYASRPAVCNMPKPLRAAWRPIGDGITTEVDFQSFELNILLAAAGLDGQGDFFADTAEKIGTSRAMLKSVFNPLLHGQTIGNLVGAKKWVELECRKSLEEFLRRYLPELWAQITLLQQHPNRLQRKAAEVFFASYEAALAAEDVPAGIPIHDGWLFPARDEAQANRIRKIFEDTAGSFVGGAMPVNLSVF